MNRLFLAAAIAAFAGCGGKAPPAPAAAPAFAPKTFSVKVSGAGRPVIFIPGLTCDGAVWDGTIAHLGGKMQAHVLSLAGFAGKPPVAEPLMPSVKDEIIAYVKANHLDHPVVVGHSLGGFLTFWLLESEPALFGGGVAVDGAPFLPGLENPEAQPAALESGAKAMQAMLTNTPREQFRTSERQMLASMITRKEDVDRVAATSSLSDQRTVGEAFYFLMTTDLRGDVGKIQAPVTVIAADEGDMPHDKLEHNWAVQIAAIPRHNLVLIPRSKHFVMLDQPDAFYAALDAALK